jgi:hypothetical protein
MPTVRVRDTSVGSALSRVDADFLGRLAAGRDRGVLVRLDVPTWRQAQPRVQMLAEQNMATVRVDRHDEGDQVLVRDVRYARGRRLMTQSSLLAGWPGADVEGGPERVGN